MYLPFEGMAAFSADDYSGKGIAVLVLVCSPGNIPPGSPL